MIDLRSVCRYLRLTTDELIRVQRDKFPDTHGRAPGDPLHAVRQSVIPTGRMVSQVFR